MNSLGCYLKVKLITRVEILSRQSCLKICFKWYPICCVAELSEVFDARLVPEPMSAAAVAGEAVA